MKEFRTTSACLEKHTVHRRSKSRRSVALVRLKSPAWCSLEVCERGVEFFNRSTFLLGYFLHWLHMLRLCLWLYCLLYAIPKSGSSVLVALATDKRNDFICTSADLRRPPLVLALSLSLSLSLFLSFSLLLCLLLNVCSRMLAQLATAAPARFRHYLDLLRSHLVCKHFLICLDWLPALTAAALQLLAIHGNDSV